MTDRVRRGVAGAIAATLIGWSSLAALACPFCSAPSLTLSEQFSQADAVALATWEGGIEPKGDDSGESTYAVTQVGKSPKGLKLEAGSKIKLGRYRGGKPGDLYILLGTKPPVAEGAAAPGIKSTADLDWGSPVEATKACWEYTRNAPSPERPVPERLRFFMEFLEHADPMVATDAYGEFANAQYSDIVQIGKELPRDRLRTLLTHPDTSPSRLGLYGLLLGLCGDATDAARMEEIIVTDKGDFRLGIDGIMGGYLVLTGEQGLQRIEDAKLKNLKAPFSETYAAMQAVRFMWQYGDGQIAADRLRQSMRLLLDRPQLADLVIADLARWKDWSIQDRLMSMYDDPEFNIPSIKRAIVRYFLVATKNASDGGEPSEPAVAAAKHLADLEQRDPKTAADARKFFLFK